MKQTVQSKYILELTQQEFATILAAVFSTTEVNLKKYYSRGGANGLSNKDFDIIIKGLDNLQNEFQTKNTIIYSSDLIKGLLADCSNY